MTSLNNLADRAIESAKILKSKGVDQRFCTFSADPDLSSARIWAPSQAMTKFQMEQALGDWAEDSVHEAINSSGSYKAIPFGDNDKTLSEDDNFSDLYRAGKKREMEFGKRSDLLLFEAATSTPIDASSLSGPDSEALCKKCIAGLEVRSSRTSAQRYIAYQKEQRESGKRPTRMEPSFTVKVEDLAKVYRWIARNGKPIAYVQVFFDSIYALNFSTAFDFINEQGQKLKLENPARSGKYTIMIPLSTGLRVGDVTHPEFTVVHNQHANGRHDIYAVPHGGSASINMQSLLSLL